MAGAASHLTIDCEPGHGVEVEMEVKRSRFLTRLVRVSEESAARAIVDDQRRTHHGARHHCSAFVLGPQGLEARSSDDGEPAGTAGVPMLQVLQHHGVTDVVAVVTRYFGGIKLGAGGLVRAYSDAVGQALAVAGTRRVELRSRVVLEVSAAQAGLLEDQLRSATFADGSTIVVEGIDWGQRARIRLAVPAGTEVELGSLLGALTGRHLDPHISGQVWVDGP